MYDWLYKKICNARTSINELEKMYKRFRGKEIKIQMDIQNVISNAVEGAREFLAAVRFDEWYGVLIAVISSITSELLFVLVSQFGKTRNNEQHFKQQDENRMTFMKICLYIIFYAIFLALSVLAYVVTQNIRLGSSGIWWNFLNTLKIFWDEYKLIMLIVPIVVKGINLATKGKSQIFRIVTIFILILAMLFSPSMITYPAGNRLMIEPLLLEQLKETPFPFVTRFYDAEHFWDIFGYIEPEDDDSYRNSLANESMPSGETEGMNFDELMRAAEICDYYEEKNLKAIYLEAAYVLYQKEKYEDSFYVGLMWFYKGESETKAEFYYKGGEVYERISQYRNAVICYVEAYKIDAIPEYAEKAIECYYQYEKDTGTRSQKDINIIAHLLLLMQGFYEDDIPYLDDFCEMYPNNRAIQTVGIMRHIEAGIFGTNDMKTIERLKSQNQNQNCPKLMLAEQYYNFIYGKGADIDDIYAGYQQDGEKYEAEDILNLAWFMYMNGEYTRAYKLATDANAILESGEMADAYPLIIEIYLQDVESLPPLNGEELVTDSAKAVSDMAPWYSDDGVLRFNLAILLISNRIGLELDLSEVTGQARKFFNGDTFMEGLIQATLDFEDGNYSDCVERCDQILEMEVSDVDRHKALFLETDVLIEMAKETSDPEEKVRLLEKAEEAMKAVQKDVEDDYIECLNRLSAIYNDMPDRESERMAINDILQAFN